MWKLYRKRLVFTQVFIALAAAVLYFFGQMPPMYILGAVLLMQLGGILGAWYGHRLVRAMEREAGSLPLDQR